MKESQYLHFESSVGKRLISVAEVVEVIPMVFLQREASDVHQQNFCGLLNFRGNIVPVFNLSAYEQSSCFAISNHLIIASTEAGLVGIVALEVDYLVDIQATDLRDVSPTQGQSFMVAKIDSDMVRIVSATEFIR